MVAVTVSTKSLYCWAIWAAVPVFSLPSGFSTLWKYTVLGVLSKMDAAPEPAGDAGETVFDARLLCEAALNPLAKFRRILLPLLHPTTDKRYYRRPWLLLRTVLSLR
jgi:hypothetical protein